jgi:type VI protein secretion system component VasA
LKLWHNVHAATRVRRVECMAGVSKRRVDHIETMDGPEILN